MKHLGALVLALVAALFVLVGTASAASPAATMALNLSNAQVGTIFLHSPFISTSVTNKDGTGRAYRFVHFSVEVYSVVAYEKTPANAVYWMLKNAGQVYSGYFDAPYVDKALKVGLLKGLLLSGPALGGTSIYFVYNYGPYEGILAISSQIGAYPPQTLEMECIHAVASNFAHRFGTKKVAA